MQILIYKTWWELQRYRWLLQKIVTNLCYCFTKDFLHWSCTLFFLYKVNIIRISKWNYWVQFIHQTVWKWIMKYQFQNFTLLLCYSLGHTHCPLWFETEFLHSSLPTSRSAWLVHIAHELNSWYTGANCVEPHSAGQFQSLLSSQEKETWQNISQLQTTIRHSTVFQNWCTMSVCMCVECVCVWGRGLY